MTNEELLEEINDSIKDIAFHKVESVYPYLAALRAVVELHPMWTDYKYTETDKELVEFCGCCQEKYPCKTIQAIEGELND